MKVKDKNVITARKAARKAALKSERKRQMALATANVCAVCNRALVRPVEVAGRFMCARHLGR